MKELWHRTIELSRGYPSLWLPVLMAAPLSYVWWQLQPIVQHQIIFSLMQPHSVLTGAMGSSSEKYWEAYLLIGLVKFGLLLIDVCGYVIAMLVTARMLGRLLAQDTQNAPYADISISSHSRSVLRLSFLTLILALALGALLGIPAFAYAASVHRTSLLTKPYVIGIGILIIYLVLAYFITPLALRLLARSQSKAIEAAELSAGRKASMFTGLAIAVISVLQLEAAHSYQTTLTQRMVFAIAGTVITALPYTPLFIALSLLAMGDLKGATQTEYDDDGSIFPLSTL